MAWRIEYGQSANDLRWYWRLINREDYNPYWIAATGGGGWDTMEDCLREIQMAKAQLAPAPTVAIANF